MATRARWLLPGFDPSRRSRWRRRWACTARGARAGSPGLPRPEAARRFLTASLDDLHDPFLLRDMRQAAARVCSRPSAEGQPILLYGDYDVDGITSVVILKKAIELAGGRVSFHIPHRLRDGYGMRAEVVEQAAAAGVKLLISVDTGIRAAEAVGAGRRTRHRRDRHRPPSARCGAAPGLRRAQPQAARIAPTPRRTCAAREWPSS